MRMSICLVVATGLVLACSGKDSRGDAGSDVGVEDLVDTVLDTTAEPDTPGDTSAGDPDAGEPAVDAPDVEEEDASACTPGAYYCDAESSMICNEDGSGGTLDQDCLALTGQRCDPATGRCYSLCARAQAEESGAGCEFWAVDLDNAENSMDDAAAGQFGVAVANVDDLLAADVRIYRDESDFGESTLEVLVDTRSVDAGRVHVFRLPRYDIDGPNVVDGQDDGPQSGMSKRAYRVGSTVPVIAYQFNPIDQRYSNDASLLLPLHALGTAHHVVAWPPANPMSFPPTLPAPNRAYVTVVGTEDGTTVTIHATAGFEGSLGTPPTGFRGVTAMSAGETRSYTLDRYHVLNLETEESSLPPDPTGTSVTSDRPVAVFSGVDLAVVGNDTPPGCGDPADCSCCAEHLEIQVMPDDALGTAFVAAHSAWRNSGGYDEYDTYRLVAVQDSTDFVTSIGVPTVTLNEGQFHEFRANTGFVLEATLPIHLVRIITAREQNVDDVGDPTMVPVPAVAQHSILHPFATAEGFVEDWVVVAIPAGSTATLDGADVATACGSVSESISMGLLDFTAYTCSVTDGAHEVTGSGPVSVDVYGYHPGGSVGFPAGFDP